MFYVLYVQNNLEINRDMESAQEYASGTINMFRHPVTGTGMSSRWAWRVSLRNTLTFHSINFKKEKRIQCFRNKTAGSSSFFSQDNLLCVYICYLKMVVRIVAAGFWSQVILHPDHRHGVLSTGKMLYFTNVYCTCEQRWNS
jgi:hypothetical protein